MEIVLFRHALAEEREIWNGIGKSDVLRPLSKKGTVRFASSINGLNRIVRRFNFIYSSQYTRAVQTSEILHGYYETAKFDIVEELNPGTPFSKLQNFLNKHAQNDVIALVGHQPDLGKICSQLISGQAKSNIRFKKGGVALINYKNGIGELQWLLTHRQLIALGSSKEQDLLEDLVEV